MVSVSCGSRQESIDWFENHQASWGLLFLDASQVDIQPQRTPAAHIVDRDGAVTLARPRWPRDMTESSVAIERELERLLEKSPANDPRNTPD